MDEIDWEERKYNNRRERFALAVFRELIRREEGSRLTDYLSLAGEAVQAADALDEKLYPDVNKQLLPDYEA